MKRQRVYEKDLVILFEHPQWQLPLLEVLQRRGVSCEALDLKKAVLAGREHPRAPVYFNQASPSAYLRGNTRAVPFTLALLEELEGQDVRVLNGAAAFRLELSKAAQVSLLRRLGVSHPRTWVFNDVEALEARPGELRFPAMLKPNQGGSGARMVKVETLAELRELLESNPALWEPDHLLLLQEFLPHDTEQRGIVRLEFLGGELLYAMRVVSHGRYNLCPSEVCNPGQSALAGEAPPPDFHPYPEVPSEAVRTARRIVRAARLDVGAVEYLETSDGRRVFYDINANSNLRRSIGRSFGFDPFERVADFLERTLQASRTVGVAASVTEAASSPEGLRNAAPAC